MLLDIIDDGLGDKIADAHLPPEEEADLGARDVILDELLDLPDIVLPGLQAAEGVLEIGAGALDDEAAVAAEDVVEVGLGPDAGRGHGLDEVGAGE